MRTKKINKNKLPSYVTKIGGNDVSEFSLSLSHEYKRIENLGINMNNLILRDLGSLAIKPEIRARLEGWGSNIVTATINKMHSKGLELLDRGKVSEAKEIFEFTLKYCIEPPRQRIDKNISSIKVDLASDSFNEKLKMLKKLKGEDAIDAEVSEVGD